jgi:hypothetical protein
VERAGQVVAAAFMGPPNNLVLSHVAVMEAIPLLASDLHRKYRTLPGVIASTPLAGTFADEWQRLSNQPYKPGMAQRIYQLEEVRPVSGVPGHIRRPTEEDRSLLRGWLAKFNEEALGQTDTSGIDRMVDHYLEFDTNGIYLWEDGRPVSMAGYGRPTPNGVVVQAVYTPPEQRGRGYASACVAALSRMLRDQGRKYCFLYTDRANPTANHIYQAIGYRPVCDADVYRFED